MKKLVNGTEVARKSQAFEVKINCPACRAGISVRGVLEFKWPFLCDDHKATWSRRNAMANRGRAR